MNVYECRFLPIWAGFFHGVHFDECVHASHKFTVIFVWLAVPAFRLSTFGLKILKMARTYLGVGLGWWLA